MYVQMYIIFYYKIKNKSIIEIKNRYLCVKLERKILNK